jgi:ankyrin repeat protein
MLYHVILFYTNQYPTAAWTPNDKGKIPLHYASREGRSALVQFLLQVAPGTAAMASGKDKLALHFAAGEGHLAVVQALLIVYPQGAALPSAKGKLPLHLCSRWGHQGVARLLLPYYPDAIRALDWEGSLPLHEACREGQVEMARILVDIFPEALATANLRQEVPLFPAVRAGSLDLVLDLCLVWPQGAAHVLSQVTTDDRLATWPPAMVETLLRAASGCLLQQEASLGRVNARPPPTVRLLAQVNHVLPQITEDETDRSAAAAKAEAKAAKAVAKKGNPKKKDKPKKEKKKVVPTLGTIDDRQARLWTAGPFASTQVLRLTLTAPYASATSRPVRCKSPLLHDETAVRPRKRVRHSYRQHHTAERPNEESSSTTRNDADSQELTFYPWHAALAAHASLAVLQHVWQAFPGNLTQNDDLQRTPLFWAVMHPLTRSDDALVTWMLQHVFVEAAVAVRDSQQAMPLHAAIRHRASSRLIKALLTAQPSSAVERIEGLAPLALACQSQCDNATLYLLLRADPSWVTSMRAKHTPQTLQGV